MSATTDLAVRRGGREARRAARAAPLPENQQPVRAGMEGGRYKPLSDAEVLKIHNAALDVLTEALAKGDSVQFVGFGTFGVTERKARTGRNPQTGATIEIAASSVPKFTAGATLKASVNK